MGGADQEDQGRRQVQDGLLQAPLQPLRLLRLQGQHAQAVSPTGSPSSSLLLFPTAARPTCAGDGHRQGGPEPAVRAVDGHGGRPVPRPPQRRVPGEQVPVLRPRGAHHPLPHQASRGEQRIALCFNLRQAAATVGGRNIENALYKRIPLLSDVPTIVFGADVTHPSPGEDASPSIAVVWN